MSSNNDDHSITGEIEKGVKDVGDAVKSGMHRSAADAERTQREVAGDTMTPGEKVKSGANEASERIKAGVDDAKRTIRDNT